MSPELPSFSVGQFVALTNQTLEYAFPRVVLIGEVASFKVNQSKFVFFDLKDAEASIGCFMMVYQLRVALEDGMKVAIVASPKLTQWGKFSLTVHSIRPVGEGSIKKNFELLKAKLTKEGLFEPSRKRILPAMPRHIGVISSTQAAGYGDFIKILDERWGGMELEVAHTQVQGQTAADQMIRALTHFNTLAEPPEVIVLIRGGGSADDLAVYNDENLVRAVAASRVPTLVGIGHEVDVSLVDLVADVRASTPSNAAQLLVPDRREVIVQEKQAIRTMALTIEREIAQAQADTRSELREALTRMSREIDTMQQSTMEVRRSLRAYDPRQVLSRGYAIVHGEVKVGVELVIEMAKRNIKAEVTNVESK